MKPDDGLSVKDILKRQQERRLERTSFFGLWVSLFFGVAASASSDSLLTGVLVTSGCVGVFGYINNHIAWWRNENDK